MTFCATFLLISASVVLCNDLKHPKSGELMLKKKARPPDLLMEGLDLNPELTRSGPAESCSVEEFDSDFKDRLVYIDKGQTALFSALYTPSPHSSLFPVVMVTDAQTSEAVMESKQVGVTSKGNEKYRLDIMVCEVSGTHAPNRGSSEVGDRLATVTVDLFGRNGACEDLRPLKVRVMTGCPPTKHLRVSSKRTACPSRHFSPEELQNNFTYTVPKDIYDPDHLFRLGSASKDLHLLYDVKRFYCPLLVYHKERWIPTLELWDAERLLEEVPADFVMFEVNGIHSYEYLQSAADARCFSQPQSWSSMMRNQTQPDPHTAWHRKNYRSCRDRRGPALTDPSAPYQVLRTGEGNRIRFLHSGMYIFKVTVVDPSYSYCDLSATFSVWVYGSFPMPHLPTGEIQGVALAVSFTLLLAATLSYFNLARMH